MPQSVVSTSPPNTAFCYPRLSDTSGTNTLRVEDTFSALHGLGPMRTAHFIPSASVHDYRSFILPLCILDIYGHSTSSFEYACSADIQLDKRTEYQGAALIRIFESGITITTP